MVVGFIRGLLIHSDSPWGSLGYPGSLGSLGFAFGVHAFIQGCWVLSGSCLGSLCSSGVVGFTRVRLVHSGAPRWSLGSVGFALGVVGFIRVSLGSLRFALRIVGFTRIRSWGHWVDSRSLGSLGFTLWVVGFIRGRWVHSGAPCGSLGSSGDVSFTQIHPSGRWLHPVLFGSLGVALEVAGFILDH